MCVKYVIAEVRILTASLGNSTLDDAARYGEARRWLTQLLRGHPVEIAEAELADSRRIMRFREGCQVCGTMNWFATKGGHFECGNCKNVFDAPFFEEESDGRA